MSANAKQVAGDHYKTKTGVQHWDIMSRHDVPYLIGNATKYLTRFRRKNGIEDLKKAQHYIEKAIEDAPIINFRPVDEDTILDFFLYSGIDGFETQPLKFLMGARNVADLRVAKVWVDTLIAEYDALEPGAGYVNQDR
jgi:hypothetical protein